MKKQGHKTPSSIEDVSEQKTFIKTFSGHEEPTEEELRSEGFLDLPLDFFDDDDYIDESIPTIGVLGEWFTKHSFFLSRLINLLANCGYIEPSLGNRRLLASILSGRKLSTHLTKVIWIEKLSRTKSQTEKVMLWLCKYLYSGNYERAYEIFGIKRTIKKGQESIYAETADLRLKKHIKLLLLPTKPRRKSNKK